jgi:phage-related tail protein
MEPNTTGREEPCEAAKAAPPAPVTAEQLRKDVEQVRKDVEATARDIASRSGKVAEEVGREVGREARKLGEWAERGLSRPGVAAIAVGTALVAVAATIGLAEAVLGGVGGWLVWRSARRARAGGR